MIILIEKSTPENMLSWTTEQCHFLDETLKTILRKAFKAEIKFKDEGPIEIEGVSEIIKSQLKTRIEDILYMTISRVERIL